MSLLDLEDLRNNEVTKSLTSFILLYISGSCSSAVVCLRVLLVFLSWAKIKVYMARYCTGASDITSIALCRFSYGLTYIYFYCALTIEI